MTPIEEIANASPWFGISVFVIGLAALVVAMRATRTVEYVEIEESEQ